MAAFCIESGVSGISQGEWQSIKYTVPGIPEIKAQQWVYVTLGEDGDGFATLLQAETAPPAQTNYLQVRAQYSNGKTVRVEMPFQRYYAKEKIASEI